MVPLMLSMVAAAISILGLVISKELKTSELRQAWIDALRADATQVVSQFIVYSEVRLYGLHPKDDRPATMLAAYKVAEAAVRLRLNGKEPASSEAFVRLDVMNELIQKGNFAPEVVADSSANFVSSIQPILKSEWQRVKRGEPGFRVAWICSLVVLAWTAVLILGYYTLPIVTVKSNETVGSCASSCLKTETPKTGEGK